MTHRPNILVLSSLYPSEPFPAAGPFVRDQVLELSERGHSITVLSPLRLPVSVRHPEVTRRVLAAQRSSREGSVEVLRPRVLDVPVARLSIEPRLWAWRFLPLLGRTFREIGGDLVHAHFALPDGFVAGRFAARARVPFVLTLWGSDVLVFGQIPAIRPLLKQTLMRTDAIIAVSEEIAERAQALGAPTDRLHVIPGGVPYPSISSREASRAELGLDANQICILWVGGLVPVKQPLQAVEAFARFVASRSDSPLLVMIGDGPLRRQVADLAERKGLERAVRLLGHRSREDVWTWQSASDLLINCSRSEGTPLAVLEALGAGTPVAAYPLPGVRAVIDAVDGGTLATEKTPSALAVAMSQELGTGRDRSALAGAARSRFNITGTVVSIEEIYVGVV